MILPWRVQGWCNSPGVFHKAPGAFSARIGRPSAHAVAPSQDEDHD
jgi:hypothetical protein